MKIINLEDFNACPPGALFSTYTPFSFGHLMIKAANPPENPGCFRASHVAEGIAHDTVEDAMEKLHGAVVYGDQLGMDFGKEFDHEVEPTQMFAVWEGNDLMDFINRVIIEMPETMCRQRALLERADKALRAWHAKHGIISDLWVPPGGDLDLLGDITKELQPEAKEESNVIHTQH